METLKETTQGLLPHIYLVDATRGKMLAYRRSNDNKIDVFSKPLSFSKRYRKFTKVKDAELMALGGDS